MIEDKELRKLFKIESEERLQHLDDGLLRLEKMPTDPPLLEDLFREAHSLKGAARMLGLTEIQTLAHQLEDILGVAKKGEAALQAEAVLEMNRKLETIRRLVQMEIGEAAPEHANVELNTETAPPDTTISQSEIRTPKSDTFRIDTMRVDPKKTGCAADPGWRADGNEGPH